MTSRSIVFAAAAVAALALCNGNVRADEPAQAPAPVDLQALRARMEQLAAQQKEAEREWHAAEEKLDAKITADELKNEAQEKSQLITAEGFTAGYTGNRFVIQSSDGNFVWRPWFHLQERLVALDRKEYKGPADDLQDQWDVGSEIRRMRFGFDGNAFTPNFQYFFNWTTNRTSGNVNVTSTTGTTKGTTIGAASNSLGGVPILEEAWIKYHLPNTPFFIHIGQMHDPILHEEMTSSRYRHSAEISLTGDIFVNGDAFTEAATVIYDQGPDGVIRSEAGVNHGMRSANTNFFSYPDNGSYNAFDYGVAGRVEYKVMGRWVDYNQVAAIDVKEPLLVFGLGGDYSERGHAAVAVGAFDGMYADQNGIMVYGEFLDRYTTHNFGYYSQSAQGASISAGDPAVAGKPTNEYSCLLEGGYLIAQHYEPFLRYEYMHLQGTPAGSKNYIQDVTTGVNWWIVGHRLKVTGEIMYLPDGLPFDDSPTDEFACKHTELVYEAQLQLLL